MKCRERLEVRLFLLHATICIWLFCQDTWTLTNRHKWNPDLLVYSINQPTHKALHRRIKNLWTMQCAWQQRDRGKSQASLTLPPPRTLSRHLVAGPPPPPPHAARPGSALAMAQRGRFPPQDGREMTSFHLALRETSHRGRLKAGMPWKSRIEAPLEFLDVAGAARAWRC